MPASSIEVKGRRTRRPGAYGTVDGSALSRRGPGIKALVLIGEAVGGKPVGQLTDGVPTLLTASSPKGVRSNFRSGLLRDAALAAFEASNDSRVAGPTRILFAKVNPATAATAILTNVGGNALNLASQDYGAFANLINVSLGIGTSQGYSFSIVAEEESEAGDNIGGDAAFDARYETTGDFATAILTINATGVSVAFTDQYPADVVLNAQPGAAHVTVASAAAYDIGQQVTVYGLSAGLAPIKETLTLNGTSEIESTINFPEVTGLRVHGGTRGVVNVQKVATADNILQVGASLTDDHDGTAVEVVSSDVDDVGQQVIVTGLSAGGVPISTVLTLNGTTAAAGTLAFGKILTARLSAVCEGTITIRGTPGGPVAFTITTGNLTGGINLTDGIYTPNKAAFAGALQFKHAAGPGPGVHDLVVRGRSTAGVETAERVVLTGAYATTTTLWASVEQIEIAAAEAANAIDAAGTAISCPVTTHPYLQQVIDAIDSAPGFHATGYVDGAPTFGLGRLDYAAASIRAAGATNFYRDLDALVLWINANSALITATRATGATGAPSITPSPVYLAGGAEGTSTAAHWQAAFDAVKRLRDVIVVVLSTTSSIHSAWVSHARYMEGAGNNARNGYVPIAITRTKAQIKTDIRALNDRNTSVVAESVDRYSEAGVRTTYGPEILAAMAGAMQAGTGVGEPLTRKVINAISTGRHSSWDPLEDAEEMIEMGLMFVQLDDEIGYRWERSITSWRNDDNPVFTEMSANESANESVNRLQRNLDLQIGEKAFDGRAATIKSMAEAELDLQVAEGVIKAWQAVSVDDLGDTFDVEYELAAIEPTNFIRITAHLRRIPASAAA